MKKTTFAFYFSLLFVLACQPPKSQLKKTSFTHLRKSNTYHLESAKLWLANKQADSAQLQLVYAINRTDKENFGKLDAVIIPDDLHADLVYYLPFPLEVASLAAVDKIIFFSYPTQTFGTYENGQLIYTGPTNMGRKTNQTPTGLFFTNWKAEETISTFNDEWKLFWNFNIDNQAGVGWHQYSLPGYPVSHSCLRLQEQDARFLYNWADTWVLTNLDSVQVKGTPVIVFGKFDFDQPKPWLKLVDQPNALQINSKEIDKITAPHLSEILAAQNSRRQFSAATAAN